MLYLYVSRGNCGYFALLKTVWLLVCLLAGLLFVVCFVMLLFCAVGLRLVLLCDFGVLGLLLRFDVGLVFIFD